MIDHVTISVSNLEISKQFYEKVFTPLGYKIAFGEVISISDGEVLKTSDFSKWIKNPKNLEEYLGVKAI